MKTNDDELPGTIYDPKAPNSLKFDPAAHVPVVETLELVASLSPPAATARRKPAKAWATVKEIEGSTNGIGSNDTTSTGGNTASTTGTALDPGTDALTLSLGTPDASQTLLGDRWLCVGGTLLFIGPSGVGKSSASMQQDILWSCGREAFGIIPARPLRILTVQSENDQGDLIEMAKGVLGHFKGTLTPEELEQVKQNTRYITHSTSSSMAFLALLEVAIKEFRPDIVRLDPLLAYIGCKIEDSEKTGVFLRQGLNPILQRNKCACILAHHTPKPLKANGKPVERSVSDYSYIGAGSAEITNYARAILVLDTTNDPHIFKFIAAKRGGRIGWRDPFGDREYIRYFEHARKGDEIYWQEADRAAVEQAAAKPGKDVAKEILSRVPETDTIGKNELVELVNQKTTIGLARLRDALTTLLDANEPKLFEWKMKRPGTNAKKLIARSPQPEPDPIPPETAPAPPPPEPAPTPPKPPPPTATKRAHRPRRPTTRGRLE